MSVLLLIFLNCWFEYFLLELRIWYQNWYFLRNVVVFIISCVELSEIKQEMNDNSSTGHNTFFSMITKLGFYTHAFFWNSNTFTID